MLGGFQFVLALVRLAQTAVRLMERQQWFNEGQRDFIRKEAIAVARAVTIKDKIKAEKLTPEQVARELEGDFRD